MGCSSSSARTFSVGPSTFPPGDASLSDVRVATVRAFQALPRSSPFSISLIGMRLRQLRFLRPWYRPVSRFLSRFCVVEAFEKAQKRYGAYSEKDRRSHGGPASPSAPTKPTKIAPTSKKKVKSHPSDQLREQRRHPAKSRPTMKPFQTYLSWNYVGVIAPLLLRCSDASDPVHRRGSGPPIGG